MKHYILLMEKGFNLDFNIFILNENRAWVSVDIF